MSESSDPSRAHWMPGDRPEKDHRSAEEREEWDLLREWQALPRYGVRFRQRGRCVESLRIECPMPESWKDTEEGHIKYLRLCDILGRDPFTHSPAREGEVEVGEIGRFSRKPRKPEE